jgi:hypothetical protein
MNKMEKEKLPKIDIVVSRLYNYLETKAQHDNGAASVEEITRSASVLMDCILLCFMEYGIGYPEARKMLEELDNIPTDSKRNTKQDLRYYLGNAFDSAILDTGYDLKYGGVDFF